MPGCRCIPVQGHAYADLVLRGGVLFISGPTRQGFGAAVGGGRILHAGPDDELSPFIGPATEVIELQGAMVLPGFHDSHAHPVLGGLDLAGCSLLGLASAEECVSALAAYARQHPGSACIRGSGWLYSFFPPRGPDRALLDAVVPDRPVYLKAVDGHTAWVNSQALALAGITRTTAAPAGGSIERCPATGEPSGTLRELSAMHLVEERLPPYAPGDYYRAAKAFMAEAARLGITSVYDAMALPGYLQAYKALDDAGGLTLGVHCALVCDPSAGPAQARQLDDMRRHFTGTSLHVPGVKFFLDGVVESHTAALLEPYADRPSFRGEAIWQKEDLQKTAAALDAIGFQLHFHAVGDRAVRMALDAVEFARRSGGSAALHQIAHCDLVADTDLSRFSSLGVIANMQPAWFYKDSGFQSSTLPFLGPGRANNLYRMNSLLDRGAIIACGSDWPVGGELITLNPLEAMQVGMSRLALHESAGEAYLPGESVNLWSMLDFYTLHGSLACLQDGKTGSIEAGRRADLTVLDRNLFEMPVADIHRAKVLLTLVDGVPVFRSGDV